MNQRSYSVQMSCINIVWQMSDKKLDGIVFSLRIFRTKIVHVSQILFNYRQNVLGITPSTIVCTIVWYHRYY